MDKKVLQHPSLKTQNQALEKAIAEVAKDNKNLQNLVELKKQFDQAELIVPVNFPPNTNMQVVLRMLKGEPVRKEDAPQMLPMLLNTSDGKTFAPAFTSTDQVKETKDFPFMIKVPAAQVQRVAEAKEKKLDGIILNPQTQSLILRPNALQKIAEHGQVKETPQGKEIRMTKEQFVIYARTAVERAILPKQFFEDTKTFVENLETKMEQFLADEYRKPYGEKFISPYTAEDFSIMILNINEHTVAASIELPAKNLAPQCAIGLYLVWDPQGGEAHYYLVERGMPGENDVLCNVTPDGMHHEQQTAPAPGSELSAVLELIREEKEESGQGDASEDSAPVSDESADAKELAETQAEAPAESEAAAGEDADSVPKKKRGLFKRRK